MNERVFGIQIRGAEDVARWLHRNYSRFEKIVWTFLQKWAMGTIRITKKEYLTDPRRVYGDWIFRWINGRLVRFRPILRGGDKIGVVTGRLRSSYGSKVHIDGIYQQSRSAMGFSIKVGTNVNYAPELIERKYDFREKGARHFYESDDMTRLVNELGRRLFDE